ncbi:hypothetical protein EF847_22290 [Actinobacteria bacterium YIM 96077]|uniref:Alcohol dehydrogenase n=1 Tax=Phytoactinopolyspora halophila TaxID=1981511 RepID=A0A329QTV6_9ACTN|nr:alcohol dehydrogenase catalytic domain-containing protein [Phytoactinopolyspora halophila]AYY15013.1 hypothetical protein EF847_22290 [Actinobacteria bacterium YIM 96077]RAW15471.1 hypothetical protein DPM12_09520 [Phytoactinopolyspora halophila]
MRAVRIVGHGEVAVRDVPEPTPSSHDVVVTVTATSVCSTDRKLATRGHDHPCTPGHEVTGLLPDGTAAGIYPEVTCGRCAACRAGWHNRCPDRESIGLARDGGLAELVSVPTSQVVPLGGLDPVTSSMLEPLACAVHAVDVCGVSPGEPAAVVGGGAMGILCGWALQAAGCPVAICQRPGPRQRIAHEMGFDVVFGPESTPRDHLDDAPAAVVVTAPGAAPLQWAVEQVALGGVVHSFAGTPGGALVDANAIHYRHLKLVGSTGSRLSDYRRARDLVASGEIKLDRLPHRVVTLEEAPAAVLERPPDGVLKTIVAMG